MTFIPAKNRKELGKKINIADYAVIKKVVGGYACFETIADFERWAKNK